MSIIKLLVIDVDGTLTDAGIYYDNNGNELKKFCTKDAAGVFAARNRGIKTLVLTGRECGATTKRIKDLQIDYLIQGIRDKKAYLTTFINNNGLNSDEIGYIGDDLNDLPSMEMVGYVACPADACYEVKQIADYISCEKGGHGAVRDIIENMLRKSGEWEKAISEVYGIGV